MERLGQLLPLQQLLLSNAFATSATQIYQLWLLLVFAGISLLLLGRHLLLLIFFFLISRFSHLSFFSLCSFASLFHNTRPYARAVPVFSFPPNGRVSLLSPWLPLLLRTNRVHLPVRPFAIESCRPHCLVQQVYLGPFLREHLATKPTRSPNGFVTNEVQKQSSSFGLERNQSPLKLRPLSNVMLVLLHAQHRATNRK